MPISAPLPDVRFDHAAAEEALVEARRTMRLIDAWRAFQHIEAQRVLAGWSGASRDHARLVLNEHAHELTVIRAQLHLFVNNLEHAQAVAAFEQGRRTANQIEWRAERLAELHLPDESSAVSASNGKVE